MMELNCLCDIYSGYAFKSFNDTSDGIPVIKIGNILSDGTIELTDCVYTEEVPKEKYYSKKDDIYIALSGATTGKIGVMQTDGLYVINQRVGIIRNKGKIPNDYLKYFLVSKSNQILKEASGCAQPNISPKQISKYDISIQTEEKMLLITQQLKKIEVILQNYRNQIDLLDELVKARFVEMFGDIISNDKNWNSKPLKELCDISRGASPRPISDYLGGTIPWIKIGDATIGDSIYINSTKEHIIKEGVRKSRFIKKGNLIFANCGVSLGFCRIINFDGCIHDGWLAFQNIDTSLNKIFLLTTINQMTGYFRKIAPGGTQPNLNTDIVGNYIQVVPPLELQNQFADFVKEVDKSRLEVQKSLKKTQELFDSLMQKYFG